VLSGDRCVTAGEIHLQGRHETSLTRNITTAAASMRQDARKHVAQLNRLCPM
jgi:hypothetical protein